MAKKVIPKSPVKKTVLVSSSATQIALPVAKPKVVTKEYLQRLALVEAIKERLSLMELPNTLELDTCSIITDLPLFFDAHLARVLFMEGDIVKPYSERLKKALSMVGIDINQVIKGLKPE